MTNNEVVSYGTSAMKLFEFLNSLPVVGTIEEHVALIEKVLEPFEDAIILVSSDDEDWFVTYAFFGQWSIGPGAHDFD